MNCHVAAAGIIFNINQDRILSNAVLIVLALSIFPASRPASIVDADELNFCVRDGNRWTLIAINTNYVDGFCPSFICQSALRSNSLEIIAPFCTLVKRKRISYILYLLSHIFLKELVTRTGFEPMLKA